MNNTDDKFAFVNYLDLIDKKSTIEKMFQLGYPSPFYHTEKGELPDANKAIQELDKRVERDKLPECYFLFEENIVIGYFFLVQDNPKDNTTWWAVDNRDQLTKIQGTYLLEKEDEIFKRHNFTRGKNMWIWEE